ncbi:LCP family protein [Streptomyces sp. AP-93]|uniref:LCP family protein n=1 Tax=Streptomyces sp. AP-93 TaxID=2929048 RepID=UPI001FAEBA05|nr:LCP family protein [Streptomyces sp. AP-93]MCJ0874969.1 LCP family protein [Streptomyces sp. AP-93]
MRRLRTSLVVLSTLVTLTALAPAAHPTSARTPGAGTNILVVGIDSRAGLSKAEKNRLNVGGKGCNCTDVMMLVHVSADERRASVVSIPRDSYVTYPEDKTPARSGKINGAYAIGGAALTIRTVEKVTGLRVDHYLETGFTGFEQAVNSLGGAVICTTKPLQDVNSGLDITTGVHEVDGRGSLRYVRARHIDNPGDLGRVRRQQRFTTDLLARLTARDALSGPLAAARTARTLLKSVRTDPGTSLEDLVRIGWALGRLKPSQREFATVPISVFDHRVPGVGSTLLWDKTRSDALWSALAADKPITGDTRIQPASGTPARPEKVQARVDDAAVALALRAAGFQVTDTSATAPATRPAGPPVIRYTPGAEYGATTLATALPGARLERVTGHDAVFDVALGTSPVTVQKVHYDRNTIEGAPAAGHQLGCMDGRL